MQREERVIPLTVPLKVSFICETRGVCLQQEMPELGSRCLHEILPKS